MTRFEALREHLAAARAGGQGFDEAWDAGIEWVRRARPGEGRISRALDMKALSATRSAWRSAYERADAPREVEAAGVLTDT